jgi:hypothetical protein
MHNIFVIPHIKYINLYNELFFALKYGIINN